MNLNVSIVYIEDNYDNLVLVNGLTLDDMKTKYNWVFNATILNAVIGEDMNGLVWYMGDWICGEWKNGTWYSGTFHDGQWDNGRWYSYSLDRYQLMNNKVIKLGESVEYSKFLNGQWLNGTWYNGTFGNIYSGVTNYDFTSNLSGVGYATWHKGDFMTGVFQNSVWMDGNFFDGIMSYSQWVNGKFFKGTSSWGVWWDGSWYGGDFITGRWKNGYFTVKDDKILSRFGYNTIPESGTTTIWEDGIFENGLFYSGYKIVNTGDTSRATYGKASSNRVITTSTEKQLELDNLGLSNNHNRTHWISGEFRNGYWYGGTWENGNFKNGVWYNGVFSDSYGNGYYSYNKYSSDWKLLIWTPLGTDPSSEEIVIYSASGGGWDDINDFKISKTSLYKDMSSQLLEFDSNVIKVNLTNSPSDYCIFEVNSYSDGGSFIDIGVGDILISGGTPSNIVGEYYTISIASKSTWYDGEWYDGLWVHGHFKGGYWYGGMWLGGNFEGGQMMS